MYSTSSSLLFAALAILLLSLCVCVNGQSSRASFREIATSQIWSPRERANVEFVRKETTFTDGSTGLARTVKLTDYFLLVGGETNMGPQNDVWASTNAVLWYFVSGKSDNVDHPRYFADSFIPASEVAHCQDRTYRQFRAGGVYQFVMRNDVWLSVDGGQRWIQKTDFAQWDPRYHASLVADQSSYLYLAGGIQRVGGSNRPDNNEVWRSINSGFSWHQMTPVEYTTGPTPRAVALLLTSGSIWGKQEVMIWMTGVDTSSQDYTSYQKDVWVSRNGGASWNPVNLDAAFGRRDDANAEITEQGLIVLAGGYSGTEVRQDGLPDKLNDVWVSVNGGYTWGQCVAEAEWDDRRYEMTLLDGQGYLYVMGGRNAGENRLNDVWKSLWSFTDVTETTARCGLTVPACGIGLKCWPTDPGTLLATDNSQVSCTACPYLGYAARGSTSSSEAAVVFLVIFAIAFGLAILALMYTYYKLRSAGVASPIPLPETAKKWWNKTTSTSGGAIGDTHDQQTADGDGLYQPLRIRDQI